MKEISGIRLYKDKKLLLLHRIDRDHWELPGGKVKLRETKEEAAFREANEEIGCDIKILEYLGFTDFLIKDELIRSHQFKAEIIKGEPEIKERDKFDKIQYINIEKEINLAPNIIKNLKTKE